MRTEPFNFESLLRFINSALITFEDARYISPEKEYFMVFDNDENVIEIFAIGSNEDRFIATMQIPAYAMDDQTWFKRACKTDSIKTLTPQRKELTREIEACCQKLESLRRKQSDLFLQSLKGPK